MQRFCSIALLCAALLTGCGCDLLFSRRGGDEEARLRELRRRIDAVIGEPRAQEVAHCRVIGLGVKPCGGPWTYLIYSAEQTDTLALHRLVREYNATEARLNARTGRISDCAMVMPPRLALEAGVCRAAR